MFPTQYMPRSYQGLKLSHTYGDLLEGHTPNNNCLFQYARVLGKLTRPRHWRHLLRWDMMHDGYSASPPQMQTQLSLVRRLSKGPQSFFILVGRSLLTQESSSTHVLFCLVSFCLLLLSLSFSLSLSFILCCPFTEELHDEQRSTDSWLGKV